MLISDERRYARTCLVKIKDIICEPYLHSDFSDNIFTTGTHAVCIQDTLSSRARLAFPDFLLFHLLEIVQLYNL